MGAFEGGGGKGETVNFSVSESGSASSATTTSPSSFVVDREVEKRYSLFGLSRVTLRPFEAMSSYEDNAFDRLCIGLFSRKLAEEAGPEAVAALQEGEGGGVGSFEGFAGSARAVLARYKSQAELARAIRRVLNTICPPWFSAWMRAVFKPTRLVCEASAFMTGPMFSWLVGPLEIFQHRAEDTVEARRDREGEGNAEEYVPPLISSGLQIQKCRYLEVSGCSAQCINLCKRPTQDFFREEFGLPVYLKPNFEDGSCQLIFGQLPPPDELDPALVQGCLSRCPQGTNFEPAAQPMREGGVQAPPAAPVRKCHRIDWDDLS